MKKQFKLTIILFLAFAFISCPVFAGFSFAGEGNKTERREYIRYCTSAYIEIVSRNFIHEDSSYKKGPLKEFQDFLLFSYGFWAIALHNYIYEHQQQG